MSCDHFLGGCLLPRKALVWAKSVMEGVMERCSFLKVAKLVTIKWTITQL